MYASKRVDWNQLIDEADGGCEQIEDEPIVQLPPSPPDRSLGGGATQWREACPARNQPPSIATRAIETEDEEGDFVDLDCDAEILYVESETVLSGSSDGGGSVTPRHAVVDYQNESACREEKMETDTSAFDEGCESRTHESRRPQRTCARFVMTRDAPQDPPCGLTRKQQDYSSWSDEPHQQPPSHLQQATLIGRGRNGGRAIRGNRSSLPPPKPRRRAALQAKRVCSSQVPPGASHHGNGHKHDHQTTTGNLSWVVRSVLNGYEDLLYSLCDSNESPNVVFAALCYQRSDVYTMVLKNCVGKRRYWYDKTAVRGSMPYAGEEISDFERAMRWRASVVGRNCTAPGYDLATFVLQNVATDKRTSSFDKPLILVTTSDTLTDPSVGLQIFDNGCESEQRMLNHVGVPAQHKTDRNCLMCRSPAGVLTRDNASVAKHTCWRHASSYLLDADAEWTRVCNAIVLDMQFAIEEGAPVCRVRLFRNGVPGGAAPEARRSRLCQQDSRRGGAGDPGFITIAELVALPFGVQPTDQVGRGDVRERGTAKTGGDRIVDLNTAHGSSCVEEHHNVEDLFMSMPVKGLKSTNQRDSRHGIRPYDTTIGRVVDLMHCITCNFQA